MKRVNARLWVIVVFALAVALIAGCSGSNGSNGSNTAASTGSATAANSDKREKVTLRFAWWGAQERNKATLDAINLYMKNNPHVNIEAEYMDYNGYYEKLVAQLSGGTAPDIFQIVDRWFLDLAGQRSFLLDMGTQQAIDFNTLDPEFMKTQMYNGKMLGFPAGLQGAVLLYNKAFFKKFGIPEDTVWTWDNLIEWGQKVHEQDENSYLFVTDSDELDNFLRSYQKQLTGNQWVQDDFTTGWTKEDMVKILTFVQNLFDKNAAEPMDKSVLYKNKSNENPAWINGNLGMQYKYISTISNYLKIEGHDLGVAALPVGPDMKDTGVFTGSNVMISINSDTKNAEEAGKFVNWMHNDPEAIAVLGTARGVPATSKARDILVNEDKIEPLIGEAMDIALKTSSKLLPDNAVSQDQELYRVNTDIWDKVSFGKLAPEEAADELIKQYEAKLAVMKK